MPAQGVELEDGVTVPDEVFIGDKLFEASLPEVEALHNRSSPPFSNKLFQNIISEEDILVVLWIDEGQLRLPEEYKGCEW